MVFTTIPTCIADSNTSSAFNRLDSPRTVEQGVVKFTLHHNEFGDCSPVSQLSLIKPFTSYFTVFMRFLFAFLALPALLSAQLTLRVTAIPANTPAGATIYAAGTFNNWSPGNSNFALTANSDGTYSIVLNPTVGQVKFKFTRGDWNTVEGDANGNFLADRTLNYNGTAQTINLTILSWEGNAPNGTAAANVSILDEEFFIPQLNRYRRIWLYLPPDYTTATNKLYPVLYMHDGQNLFDDNTSFSGEWEVDETLNTLHAAGDYGCIVVGIDNGGADRLNEYSPWVNPQYGGGQGEAYIEFIVNTLKPHIDANYRTLSGRNSTGIMGSSMGGLISMYGFSEHQNVFSRVGIFSPAFWFADSAPADHVAAHPKEGPARVYFLAGGQEPQYVETDMDAVAAAMTTAGFTAAEKRKKVPSNGQHSEWFWAQEFGEAYEWLFANAVSSTQAANAVETLAVYPNPVQDRIYFDLPTPAGTQVEIWNANGRLCLSDTLSGQAWLEVAELPAGFYMVKLRSANSPIWSIGKLVK
jgi:predicted alpha/beta superfamily hydrolase